MIDFPIINSHNGWSKLEEVWLGDIYPDSWYATLPNEIEDTFCKINEVTRQDLTEIQLKLEEFGVVVRRPEYKKIENHLIDGTGILQKPEITPRDFAAVIGNTLIFNRRSMMEKEDSNWNYLLDEYSPHAFYGGRLESNFDVDNGNNNNATGYWHQNLNGANIVRYGDKIIWDTCDKEEITIAKQQEVAELFPDFEWHFVNNGGHLDGCFQIVKPGLLLTSYYFDDYEKFFPGWKCITVSHPEFAAYPHKTPKPGFTSNNRWWMDDFAMPASFNKHIIQYAKEWVGNPMETFFEINSLMLDEHNICILGEKPKLFQALEQEGLTVHSLPFRARTFWDGGLHCLTVDIRRRSYSKKVL